MRTGNVLGAAAVIGLIWWGSATVVERGGAAASTTTIDVRNLLGLDPAQPAPAPAPAPPEVSTGDQYADSAGEMLSRAWSLAGDSAAWVRGHVVLLVAILAACLLLLVMAKIRKARTPVTDPVRAYSSAQRAESFARAGGQCEYMSWGLSRCTADAEHADHLFPWSKGGATSLANCVASCAHHNTSKGAKILPRWKVTWLQLRRRRYYPAGVPVTVGQKYDPRRARDVVGPAAPAPLAGQMELPPEPVPLGAEGLGGSWSSDGRVQGESLPSEAGIW